jgi:hypothetical protein
MTEFRIGSLVEELLAREESFFDLSEFCFKEQLDFITDPAQFKTGVCSRRAGKTVGCAADLLNTAKMYANVVCLYITLSRVNASRIMWPELLRINREKKLGGHPNATSLSLTFPNGSVIYCTGAKHKQEIENFRGLPIKKAYVDECQSFRAYIRDLIDDVLSKALFDHAGTLCLTGTPGLIPAGYFYECSQSKEWSHHHWTMFQNPHLERKSGKTVMELVLADCKRMGVSLDHPKIQRECYGRWVVDTETLIFKYAAAKNDHAFKAERLRGWDYVVGVDIGHDDADAIAVIGWDRQAKHAFLVEELINPKQGITELADQIEAVMTKYNPLKVVMDTGGLGKKIAEEIRRRRSIPVMAAEKSRKMEFIELLNDAMRTARFFARKDSAFAQDCFLVEKDEDKTTVDKIVISDKYHSDICDAVLYAFRESLHWLAEPEERKPAPGTPEHILKQEREMEEAAESAWRTQNEDDFLTEIPLNGF